jgi:cob(I)alamin adenosyltransferase
VLLAHRQRRAAAFAEARLQRIEHRGRHLAGLDAVAVRWGRSCGIQGRYHAPMGNRLTQIATRTGDDGTTGLGDGASQDHLRVQAMGDVDELNSHIGVLLAEPLPDDVRELLVVIQHELFNLGGELSIPGFELLKDEAVARLDEALAHTTRAAAAEGIHPAGRHAQRAAHVCRTVAAAPSARWWRWPREASRGAAPVPEPPVRPAVRAGPRAQPRQPRRPGGDDVYWHSERLKRLDAED